MSTPSKSKNAVLRGPLFHLAIVGVSVAVAAVLWTRDEEPKIAATNDVTVWAGHPGDVEHIVYESKTKKVVLDAKKDALGSYLVGVVDMELPTGLPDAGAGAPATSASAKAPTPPAPNALPGRVVITFVSITAGNKLTAALAPFKALRALGKIADDQTAEFGLAQPDATVSIKGAFGDKRLLLGALTPGGGDRYIKEASTGEVFVVRGEPFRFLDAPESWMIERELHTWKEAEVVSATVSAGGKSRKVVHAGPEGKQFWADSATATSADDALDNWMSKIYRLRAVEFVSTPPQGREPVLRVDFMGSKPLGYVEIVKTLTGPDGSPEYFIQSERTRLFAKGPNTFIEQIEQDLGVAIK